ncbi:MAG: tetratricopeptide repeat protein [Betaproteobacteria bacterium]|nr:tetratricopeptide repeat protein [Betaproteobacteria bacterium]
MLKWLAGRRTPRPAPEELAERADSLLAAGDLAAAEGTIREALDRSPRDARLHARLGTIFHARGDRDGAIAAYREAWSFDPAYAQMPYNLAIAEAERGNVALAVERYREAIALRPDFLEAWFNLACLHFENNDAGAAREAYVRVLELDPAHVEARLGLGVVLQEMRSLEESEREFDRVLEADPANAGANVHKSFNALIRGDLREGWRRYAYRWQLPAMVEYRRHYPVPRWQGENPGGLRILVYPEQGFGDILQFVRFVPRLVAAGAHVILEAPGALCRLFGSLEGVELVPMRQALPPFDRHVSIMDLAEYLAPSLEDAGMRAPYLTADPDDVARWRARVSKDHGFKVGIAWSGDPRPDVPDAARIDRKRSLSFDQLRPLAAVEGVSWYSLQLGAPAAQARRPGAPLALVDFTSDLHDFADTAALMMALDLVVTVDTSVVHLAGALGRPAWMLSRFDGCWRWMLEGEDSSWYPTVRVFRQGEAGNWAPVLEALSRALRDRVGLAREGTA